MWQFEHSIETDASAEAIWRLYSDPGTWPTWDAGIEAVELRGPFAAGTEGVLTPAGQGPLAFRMTEVTPERGFTDETDVPGATLRFIHRLVSLANGGTHVTHRVEIDGTGAEGMGRQMGPQVTSDIPKTMESLARHALGSPSPA